MADHAALVRRVLLTLLATAVLASAGGVIATDAASAEPPEGTTVALTGEQARKALYASLVGSTLTSMPADEERKLHVSGTLTVLEVEIIDRVDEIEPMKETTAELLKKVFEEVPVTYTGTNEGGTARELSLLAEKLSKVGSGLGNISASTLATVKKGVKDVTKQVLGAIDSTVAGVFDPSWWGNRLGTVKAALPSLAQLAQDSANPEVEKIAADVLPPSENPTDTIPQLESAAPQLTQEVQALQNGQENVGALQKTSAQDVANIGGVEQQALTTINAGPTTVSSLPAAEVNALNTDTEAVDASLSQADLSGEALAIAGETSQTLSVETVALPTAAADATKMVTTTLTDTVLGAIDLTNVVMAAQLLTQAPAIISSIVDTIAGIPSTEKLTFEYLQQIEEMIEQLSKQVAGGFSRVDQGLEALNNTLERDTTLLEDANAHIGALTTDMAHLEEQLDQLQADIREIAKTQREEALVADLDTDIGYTERAPGQTPMPLYDFEQAAGTFFAWGTYDPTDSLSELPPGSWPVEAAEIFPALGNSPSSDALDYNLDYLAAYADERHWGDGEELSRNLPNPEVWAEGTSAFSQLLIENPEDVTEPLTTDLGELKEVGDTLPEELRKLTKPGPKYGPLTANGSTIETGSSIFNHALANYLEVGTDPQPTTSDPEPSLLNRVEAEEHYFLSQKDPGKEGEPNCSQCALAAQPETSKQGDTGTANVKLWDGAEQNPSPQLTPFEADSSGHQPEEGGKRTPGLINACDAEAGEAPDFPKQEQPLQLPLESRVEYANGSGPIEAHPNVLRNPIQNIYANAWHLGLGHLTACYTTVSAVTHILEETILGFPEDTYFFENVSAIDWYWYDNKTGTSTLVLQLTLVTPHESEELCEGSGHPDRRLQELWSPTTVEKTPDCKNHEHGYGRELGPYYQAAFAQSYAQLAAAEKLGAVSPEGCTTPASENLREWRACANPSEKIREEATNTYHTVLTEVSKSLKRLRVETYEDIAPAENPQLNASGEDVRKAAQRLNGARALLDDYIELGLPASFGEDSALATLVLGPGHLLDDSPGEYELYNYFSNEVEREEETEAAKGLEEIGVGLPFGDPAGHEGVLEKRMKTEAEALATQTQTDIANNAVLQPSEPQQVDPLITSTQARVYLTRIALSQEEVPTITKQPVASTVVEGGTATFTAEAGGNPTIRWEVSKDGGATFTADATDPGSTANTLKIEDAAAAQSGYEYRAKFENGIGSTTSVAASLSVIPYEPPTVTSPTAPGATTVTEPETATLTAEASGSPKPSVQWEVSMNGGGTWSADITDPGNTTNTLKIEDTTFLENGYEYRARFQNQSGGSTVGSATSPPVTLTVVREEPPEITKQPASMTVIEPATAKFTAEASGVPTPTVQWEVSTNGGATFLADTTDPGNTTNTLKIEKTSTSESGYRYRAKFRNAVTSVTSEAVALTVEKPPTPEFTIEAGQEVNGSGAGFTNSEVTPALGQTVRYEITVHNTGNVPLKLSNFTDANCANIAGGPGVSELAPSESTAYSCERAISHSGTYVDEASVEGTPPPGDGFALLHTSNQLIATGPIPSPTVETGTASEVGQRSAIANATVNPHGGKVTSCTFQYGTTTLAVSAPCSKLPAGASAVTVSAKLTGLSPSTTYQFRISATSSSGTNKGTPATFKTTAPLAPTVETGGASEIGQRSALAIATVNPRGGEVTSCRVEYGTTSLTLSAPCSKLPGSGFGAVAVSAQLKGLAPNNTYLYRISASDLAGTSKGFEGTFKTTVAFAPTVETGGASEVGATTAVLNATVNPNGAEITTCRFEYGTTTLTLTAPCSKLPGAGISTVAVSAALKGLAAKAHYRFRISATSLSGTSKGTEGTFTT